MDAGLRSGGAVARAALEGADLHQMLGGVAAGEVDVVLEVGVVGHRRIEFIRDGAEQRPGCQLSRVMVLWVSRTRLQALRRSSSRITPLPNPPTRAPGVTAYYPTKGVARLRVSQHTANHQDDKTSGR